MALPEKKNPGDLIKSQEWNDTLDEIRTKVNRAGDMLEGSFSINGPLTIGNPQRNGSSGTAAPQSKLQVSGLAAIDEANGWANFGSNFYFDGDWKRIDNTKAGANLHMNGADGSGQEFRFARVQADGSNIRNIAVIGTTSSFIGEGNLGIGTPIPQARLNISEASGTVASPNTGTFILDHEDNGGASSIVLRSKVNRGSDYGFIQYQDAATPGGSGESARLVIGISNDPDDHLILQPAGNVGIGTPDPQAKLDVQGAIRAGTSDIYFTDPHHNHTGIGNTEGFAAIENAESHEALMILGRSTSSGRVVKVWDSLQVNGSLQVTGNITGDLTAPDGVLGFGAKVRQMINLWDTSYGIGIQNATQYYRSGTNFAWYVGGQHDDNELNAGGGTAAMVLHGGNLGIGTASPTGRLQIVGTTDFDSTTRLDITNGSNNYGRTNLILTGRFQDNNDAWNFGSSARNSIVFAQNAANASQNAGAVGTEQFSIQLEGNSNSLGFLTAQRGTTPALVIQQNGYIGLGTPSAGAPLDIRQPKAGWLQGIRLQEAGNDGNLTGRFFQIYYEGQGTIVFYHQTGNGQFMTDDGEWRHNSDLSLKEGVSKLQGMWNKVMQLRPVKFTWRGTGTEGIGFVAQDVELVFPELVSSITIDGKSIKGLPYAAFGVLAIAAIQEMANSYEKRLKTLEAQIGVLAGSARLVEE